MKIEISLRNIDKEIDNALIKIKHPRKREKVIFNFLFYVAPVLEYWLGNLEKFQQIVKEKWEIDFKLPPHFQSCFVEDVDDLKRLYSIKIHSEEFSASPIYKLAKRILDHSFYPKKNCAGSINLLLLLESFYFYFIPRAIDWAPKNKVTRSKCNQNFQFLVAHPKVRKELLEVMRAQKKKNFQLSSEEIIAATKVFNQIFKKTFA